VRALPWPLVSILLLGDVVAAQSMPERASDAAPGQAPCAKLVDALDDGIANRRVRYRYDPDARLVIEEWRFDRGDELQSRTRFSYDTSGRLLETTLDEGDDGVVDVRTTYTWDCWRP